MAFTISNSPLGIGLAATVVILTPWVPVLSGFGSTAAAAIVFMNVGLGYFAHKSFVDRTES